MVQSTNKEILFCFLRLSFFCSISTSFKTSFVCMHQTYMHCRTFRGIFPLTTYNPPIKGLSHCMDTTWIRYTPVSAVLMFLFMTWIDDTILILDIIYVNDILVWTKPNSMFCCGMHRAIKFLAWTYFCFSQETKGSCWECIFWYNPVLFTRARITAVGFGSHAWLRNYSLCVVSHCEIIATWRPFCFGLSVLSRNKIKPNSMLHSCVFMSWYLTTCVSVSQYASFFPRTIIAITSYKY